MDGKKDALAEPCFMLIGEIFELRGSKQCCLLFIYVCTVLVRKVVFVALPEVWFVTGPQSNFFPV